MVMEIYVNNKARAEIKGTSHLSFHQDSRCASTTTRLSSLSLHRQPSMIARDKVASNYEITWQWACQCINPDSCYFF